MKRSPFANPYGVRVPSAATPQAPPPPGYGTRRPVAGAPPRAPDPLDDVFETGLDRTEPDASDGGEPEDDDYSAQANAEIERASAAEPALPQTRPRAVGAARPNLANFGNTVKPHAVTPANPRGLTPMQGHATERTAGIAAAQTKVHTLAPTPEGQVRYAFNREKYRIAIARTLTRRGMIFDTAQVKGLYHGRGHVLQSAKSPAMSTEQDEEWRREGMIWVCVPNPHAGGSGGGPAFYSHVGKQHRFHHSSLSLGADVICAGEWIVRNGTIVKISANSGHYRPTLDRLFQAVVHLAAAHTPEMKVLVYDRGDQRYVEVGVRDFIARPSNSGRHKAHELSDL